MAGLRRVDPATYDDSDSTPDAGELPPLDLTPRTGPSAADAEHDAGGDQRRSSTSKGRGYVIAIVCVLLALGGVLVIKALGSATLYFYQADEAVAQKSSLADKRFRMLGNVEANTVQRTGDGVSFTVSYDNVKVPVNHVGDPPELFKSGVPVVLEGHWSADGSTFASDRILVKHTEDYVEKNPDRKTEADLSP